MKYYELGLKKIFAHAERSQGDASFYLDLADGGTVLPKDVLNLSNFYAITRRNEYVQVGLIPDDYILGAIAATGDNASILDRDVAFKQYESRQCSIYWRGATTGRPPQNEMLKNKRVQFCVKARTYFPTVNAKITNTVGLQDAQVARRLLEKMNVTAPPVPETEFGKYQAYIDLDGYSSAWGTILKYLQVIHVIKPKSDVSMFYYLIQPRNTFTQVQDVEEVFERIAKDKHFPNNFEVAWRGYLFALQVKELVVCGDATIFPNDTRFLN